MLKGLRFNISPKLKVYWNIYEVSSKFYNKDSDSTVLNLINHTWLFPEIDFSNTKRMIRNMPTCCIPNDNNCMFSINNFTGINFNTLRMEYASMHLKYESLCFSPNNLKFNIKKKVYLIDNWFIVLDESSQEHVLLYAWFFTDHFDSLEKCLEKSNNILEFITCLCNEEKIGPSHPALMRLSNFIFSLDD